MDAYQKAVFLVFRLLAIILIGYTIIAAIPAAFVMPQAIWVMLPSLVGGIVLYMLAKPLAKIVTSGMHE